VREIFVIIWRLLMKKGISILTALKKYELNQKQVLAVEAIKNNKIVVLRGRAGTAKTFTSVYAAMKLLQSGAIERIAVTRPQVTTEKMGFLPGDISSKFDPYLDPIISFFNKFGDAGEKTFEGLVVAGKIRKAPIAFLRGATIEDELMIVDESQNITPEQMLMILTRIGKNGKIVINGDEMQNDLKVGMTGLDAAILLSKKLPYIQCVTLTDNMREEIINEIIENWYSLLAAA
jgi:phosphate starvation-inducible protein PhoH and related proteins